MRVLFSLALCAVFCSSSVAGEYPEKNSRMIVSYPAGGTTDILARAIQQPMSTLLGQPIIIENKDGGGGNHRNRSRSQPDGYTIGFGDLGPNAIMVSFNSKTGYDAVKDFAAVSVVANMPLYLVAKSRISCQGHEAAACAAAIQAGRARLCFGGDRLSIPCDRRVVQRDGQRQLQHIPYKGGLPP